VTNYIFHFNNAPHDPVISLYVHYIYIYALISRYIPLYLIESLSIPFWIPDYTPSFWWHTNTYSLDILLVTLWLFNIAMENRHF
jgi:hypothetical protein